jgi:predicted RNase H-related nuclease YkuK (DUF458 family)
MTFKNSQGISFTLKEIVDLTNQDCEYQIFLGTDSQLHKSIKSVIYATCIVLYKKGKGGIVFTKKKKNLLNCTLKERLMKEVWLSLEVAFELSSLLTKNIELIVHIDVNKSPKHKSGSYMHELVSLIAGQGFKVAVKPDAWAAQSVADRFCKKRLDV